jgi:hypothetical protein
VKDFGKLREAPVDAIVHFHGDDPEEGPILRYTVVTHGFDRTAGWLHLGVSGPVFQEVHLGF